MVVQLLEDCFGLASLFFTALKELISNWRADFRELKDRHAIIKVVSAAVLQGMNAYTVIRNVAEATSSGYILYQGNPRVTQYLFSAASVFGIVVSAAEDYFKRYSRSMPSFVLVTFAILSFFGSFAGVVVAQGVFMFSQDNPNPGERTTGVIMTIIPILLTLITIVAVRFMNKVILRLSLLINVAIIPGTITYMLFSWAPTLWELFQGVVLYTSYMYPVQILSELFVLALICRQRKVDEEISSEKDMRSENLCSVVAGYAQ